MKWEELAATSHYQTAVAVEDALRRGDVSDARAGIEELIEALSRAERRALKTQLIRLMAHIIKWKTQPDMRSISWKSSIRNARSEIADIQEETPSLNRTAIEAIWGHCLERAIADAEDEMRTKSAVKKLTWNEVFEKEYKLD